MLIPKVSCGLFGVKEDHIQSYQSLDERLIRDKASTFFFEASGDSMRPLIQPKDILIVDRSFDPVSGCVAVVGVDGELYCKRLKWLEGGELILQCENPSYKDKKIQSEQEVQVFGVVTSVIRDLLPHYVGRKNYGERF